MKEKKIHLASELIFTRVHRPTSNDDSYALGSGSHVGDYNLCVTGFLYQYRRKTHEKEIE